MSASGEAPRQIINSEYARMTAALTAQYQYERAERLQAELDTLRNATPQTWRGVNTRTRERGTVSSTGYSPATGIWTAEILYDGDTRLTSVPLSEIEPAYAEEGP